jgi:hypothetical protein
MEAYIYQSLQGLKDFRVLEVAAGTNEEPIICSLRQVSLNQPPVYEAISYTWGEPTLSEPLIVDSKQLWITKNLYSALRRLRLPYESRVLWADGVCINQSNVDERSQQVRIMRHIYQCASQVLVYLGEEGDNSEFVRRLIVRVREATRNAGSSEQITTSILKSWSLTTPGTKSWQAFMDLFHRPWFHRIWVIQEFVMAQRILFVCGQWTCPLDDLESVILTSRDIGVMGTAVPMDEPIKTREQAAQGHGQILLMNIYRNSRQREGAIELFRILEECRYSRATDPKDYLFGLLGLTEDADEPCLAPDYSQSQAEILQRYARFLVGKDHSLELLFNASCRPKASGLPSWVPDWSPRKPLSPARLDVPLFSGEDSIYRAAGRSEPRMSLSNDSDILIIRGGLVDRVIIVGHHHNFTNKPLTFEIAEDRQTQIRELSIFFSHFEQISAGITEYPTGEEISDVKWRTLVGNKVLLAYPQLKARLESQGGSSRYEPAPPNFADSYKYFSVWLQWYRGIQQGPGVMVVPAYSNIELPANSDDFLRSKEHVIRGRKFCHTEKGYFGQVPRDTAPGDLVCIFSGGGVPFIVRKQNETYQIIGECYIHGIMNGEALGRDDFRFEDIALS